MWLLRICWSPFLRSNVIRILPTHVRSVALRQESPEAARVYIAYPRNSVIRTPYSELVSPQSRNQM